MSISNNEKESGKIVHGIAGVIVCEDGRVLLLRRAADYYNFPGKWSVITGHILPNETSDEAVLREIREELQVEATIISAGSLVYIRLPEVTLVIHPFKCKISDYQFTLNSENECYQWVLPKQIRHFDTVPQLEDDLRAIGLFR